MLDPISELRESNIDLALLLTFNPPGSIPSLFKPELILLDIVFHNSEIPFLSFSSEIKTNSFCLFISDIEILLFFERSSISSAVEKGYGTFLSISTSLGFSSSLIVFINPPPTEKYVCVAHKFSSLSYTEKIIPFACCFSAGP